MNQRLRLGLIHWALSCLITAVCSAMIFLVWYPDIMPKVYGIYRLYLIFFIANLIIWPGLTLMLYKTDRKKLKFDLQIMGGLQALLVVVMMVFLWQMRPIWVSYVVDSFEIVREKNVIPAPNPINPALQVHFFDRYKLVGASYSADKKTAEMQKSDELTDGISIAWRAVAVVPLTEKKAKLREYAESVKKLTVYNPKAEVAAVLAQYPQATQFLGIKGYARDATVLTNRDFTWFQPVSLLPWEEE